MNRRWVGILGCVAPGIAAVVAVAVVCFERVLVAAGVPYHSLNFSVAVSVLAGTALACGLASRRTRAGKVALAWSCVLVGLYAGFIILVLVAFSAGA